MDGTGRLKNPTSGFIEIEFWTNILLLVIVKLPWIIQTHVKRALRVLFNERERTVEDGCGLGPLDGRHMGLSHLSDELGWLRDIYHHFKY